MHAKLLSCVRLCVTLCTQQAPLSMGFCTQEYWSGLPCKPQEDLPDPGIEPAALMSPALAGRFFTTSATWEAWKIAYTHTHTHTHTFIHATCLLSCNQPWIFIGRTDAEAEAPILWPPDVKSWLSGKTLMLGKTEGKRRRGRQRIRWLDGLTDSTDMSLSKPQETAKDRKAWRVQRITKMSDTTERLNNNPEEASSDHSSLSFELDKRYSCST